MCRNTSNASYKLETTTNNRKMLTITYQPSNDLPETDIDNTKQQQHLAYEASAVRSCLKQNPMKKTNKRNRSVTFNNNVLLRNTLHLNDYTDEEFDNSFLTKFDYSVIEEMFAITEQICELGEEEDEDAGICFRGVEEQSEKEIKRRQEIVTSLLKIIYSQQRYQSRRGFVRDGGSDYLAFVCQRHTARSVQEAIEKAKQDEEYVFST